MWNCRILFCVSLDQSVKAQILQSLLQNNGSSANTEESPSTSKKESPVTLTNTRPTSPNSSLDGTQIWNWKPAEEDLLVSIRHEKNDMFLKSKNHTAFQSTEWDITVLCLSYTDNE